MLKHVVMWRLREEAEGGTREEHARTLKKRLEDLKKHIPEIREIEAGVNQIASGAACDVVLYSVFDDEAALQAYREHPAHQDVVAYLESIAAERYVVDYRA